MSPSGLLLLLSLTAAGPYPKAQLLMEPEDLLGAKAVHILDVRSREQYGAGHIPKAVWLDAKAWEQAFTSDPGIGSWSKRLGEMGIDPSRTVVIYGDQDVRAPLRMWWLLRYWGLKDVRLLHGGWPAWQKAKGPLSQEDHRPEPKVVSLTAQRHLLATKQELLQALRNKPPQIIDTRSKEEYCGTAKTAKRQGAIPGAIHLEWSELLDARTKTFKKPEELAQLLQKRGIDLSQPVVTYCQTGGRAAVAAFVLELMGGRQVKNYYRSWAEWGNDQETPIAQPKEK